MTEPIFLSLEQVNVLHEMALEAHGGQNGLRDSGALESAVSQPRNVFAYAQGDLFEIAAAYAYHIAEAQAYLDGNKRTGMAAALVFLKINGVTVPPATEQLYRAMIGLSSQPDPKGNLARILRELGRATLREKDRPR